MREGEGLAFGDTSEVVEKRLILVNRGAGVTEAKRQAGVSVSLRPRPKESACVGFLGDIETGHVRTS